MYLIIYLLFHNIQCQCYQKYKDQTIYLSPGETLKLDLQNYIYGKQLHYSSSNDCLESKLNQKNITLANLQLSDYSEYSLCYDPISGIQFGQTVQMYVKDQQVTIVFYNITDTLSRPIYKTNFKIDRNIECQNVLCMRINLGLIECNHKTKEQSTIYLINAQLQQTQIYILQINQLGPIQAGMINYINDDVVTYYKMVNFINNNRIDMYSINVTSKELTISTIIDKLIYKLQSLNLYNFLIYNQAIYFLSKELGVCYVKNYSYNYCWKFTDDFDVFSVYIEQNGFHSILLGSTVTSDIFKTYLFDDDTYKIIQMYKLSKNMTISQIYHNDRYSFIIGHKNNNTKKYYIEIYTQMDDFTSNLYKSIEIASFKEFFYFDSLNNNAYAINNRSIFIITPQVSYLTIDDGQCFGEIIEIKAQFPSIETDIICNFIFYVIKLEEGSLDIYDKQELDYSLNVLNQSINNIYLNNFVIGPNIDYYLYNTTSIDNSNENDFEKIKFKEHFTIQYAQTMDITSIIYNRAFKTVIKDQYIQIIQWKDLTLQIFNCIISDTDREINCIYKQNIKLQDPVLQVVTGLSCSTECFVIRQEKRADLYVEYNNKFINTNCYIDSQYNIQTIKLHLDKYLVELENNKIQIYLPLYKQSMTCNFQKVFEIDSLQLEELVNANRSINIFNVKTNINIFNLYISTNLGLIIIDPGLLRFQQIKLIAFVQFNQQFDTVLQVIRNRIITLQYKQIIIINLVQQNLYYTEKVLPNFNFTITNTTNSQIALSQNYFYLQAKDSNYSDVIIVYKVDEPQISAFHTYFFKNNNLDFSVIEKQDDEIFLIQLFDAQKLYSSVFLQFQSSQSKIIKVLFSGFTSYAKLMDINVNVKTAEKQYNLTLLNNDTQNITYGDQISEYIKLDGYNDFIDGSVSEWSIKCSSCQKELELINNINYDKYLTQIPNTTQIKHTFDYVLIQQEQSIIAIDNFGKVKFYIPLPLSEQSTKCTSITANTWDNKTKLVVSVCNTKSQAQFYITSFLSSFPVPMGPFYTPLLINQITHIRMLHEILFILDVVTEYVYLLNLTIDENQGDSLRVINTLNAREFTADKGQVFVSFDVAYNDDTYLLFLLTNTSQFIIYTYPQDDAYTLDLIFFFYDKGFTDIPSNIVPQSLIVAETEQKEDIQYYRIIVANQNFHHYELEISIGYLDNSIQCKFIRAYMQYGYFYANGKIRVSEETQGFFGLIYQNPLDERQKLLVVYDRFSKSQERLRKILGGYKIFSNYQILFDFLHFKMRNDEFSYGIILQDGPILNSLTLSRYLAIKVKFKEFQTQNITFNASNDFGKWVSFKANIYNRHGEANLLYIMISLGVVVFIVIFLSWLYVRNKIKQLESKGFDVIQEEDDIVKEDQ